MFLIKKKQFKKLVLVSGTIVFILNTSKKDINLNYILYIYYLVCFQKNRNNVEALINFGSEINIKSFAYTLKLGF